MTRWVLCGVLVAMAAASSAMAQSPQLHPSVCADCHYANLAKPDPDHFADWSRSPHDRAGVGCDACHGGNPNTTDPFLAHQTMVRGTGPDSPIHRANLPATCGRCHTGQFVEFQRSAHYALLQQANREGPTCSTCHGSASGFLLTPKDFERECQTCHGPRKKYERAGYASTARRFLDSVKDTRALLKQADKAIKRVADRDQRERLLIAYGQAEVPLIEAVHAAHAFVFDNADERLAVARKRAAALLTQVAAGSQPPTVRP